MSKGFSRLLGVLDIISLILLVIQFVSIYPMLLTEGRAESPQTNPLWLNPYILIPQFALIPLLALSASGHFQRKTYGLIVYYIQFPLRFPALVFTIGFVTYLDMWFPLQDISRYTLAIAVFGELLRLTYSVQTHIRIHRSRQSVL